MQHINLTRVVGASKGTTVSPDYILQVKLNGSKADAILGCGDRDYDENVVGIQKLSVDLCDRGGTECV